jgi:hypothetical protein
MDDLITVDRKSYQILVEESRFLHALYAAGVDNWEGYELAQDILEEE